MTGKNVHRLTLARNRTDPGEPTLPLLLARVARSDRRALHELYVATAPRLFGICLRISRTRQDAEEALQEAYLAVWRRAATFDPARGSAMTWLAAIARNGAIDRLRSASAIVSEPISMAEPIADVAPLVSERLQDQEDADRLGACLDALNIVDARLVRAAFYEGATYSELAVRGATPLGTVKSRIRRALLRLRECLQ